MDPFTYFDCFFLHPRSLTASLPLNNGGEKGRRSAFRGSSHLLGDAFPNKKREGRLPSIKFQVRTLTSREGVYIVLLRIEYIVKGQIMICCDHFVGKLIEVLTVAQTCRW